MRKIHRIICAICLGVAALMGSAAPAHADAGLSMMFFYFYLISGCIIFLLIILIEATVITIYVKTSWFIVVRMALWMNLASAIAGYLAILPVIYFGFPAALFITGFLLLLILALVLRRLGSCPLIRIGLALAILGSLCGSLYPMVPFIVPYHKYITAISYLLLGFGLSIAVESLYARRYSRHGNIDRAILTANLISCLVAGTIIAYFYML